MLKNPTKPEGLNRLMDMTEARVSEAEVRRSKIILCKQWTETQALLNNIECKREISRTLGNPIYVMIYEHQAE